MAYTYTDALGELKSYIDTNWNTSNVAKPTMNYIYDVIEFDLTFQGDWLLFYELTTTEKASALGNVGRDRTYNIRLDVRTNLSRDRIFNMTKEIKRLINSDVYHTFTTGKGLIELEETQDLSDKKKAMYRKIIDVKITKFNEVIS